MPGETIEDALDVDDNDDDDDEAFRLVQDGSGKGNKKLVSSFGYSYVVKLSRNDRVYWRCSLRSQKCPGSVIQVGDGFSNSRGHCHEPTTVSP
jgi:hypothetical protein